MNRDTSSGRAVRWLVVASLVAVALVVSGRAPLVGFALALVALNTAAWWFGADSRDPVGWCPPGMPE